MDKDIYREMIKTPNGGISSTRVKSWAAWKYFTWINLVFLAGFAGLVYMVINSVPEGGTIQTGVLWVYSSVWIVIDLIILLYASAPAQFAKREEVKQIIGLAGKAIENTPGK